MIKQTKQKKKRSSHSRDQLNSMLCSFSTCRQRVSQHHRLNYCLVKKKLRHLENLKKNDIDQRTNFEGELLLMWCLLSMLR